MASLNEAKGADYWTGQNYWKVVEVMQLYLHFWNKKQNEL